MVRLVTLILMVALTGSPFARVYASRCCETAQTAPSESVSDAGDNCCCDGAELVGEPATHRESHIPERAPCKDGHCPKLCCAASTLSAIVRPFVAFDHPPLACAVIAEEAQDLRGDSHTLGIERPPSPYPVL